MAIVSVNPDYYCHHRHITRSTIYIDPLSKIHQNRTKQGNQYN